MWPPILTLLNYKNNLRNQRNTIWEEEKVGKCRAKKRKQDESEGKKKENKG